MRVMTPYEFQKIIKMYGEIKDFAKTEKRLRDVLTKLNEIQKLLKRLDSFKQFSTIIDTFEQQNWMLKEYFTMSEAANYLGIKVSTFQSLIDQKVFPYYIVELVGEETKTLIKRDELFAWVQENRMMSRKEIEESATRILEQVKKRTIKNRVNRAMRNHKKSK